MLFCGYKIAKDKTHGKERKTLTKLIFCFWTNLFWKCLEKYGKVVFKMRLAVSGTASIRCLFLCVTSSFPFYTLLLCLFLSLHTLFSSFVLSLCFYHFTLLISSLVLSVPFYLCTLSFPPFLSHSFKHSFCFSISNLMKQYCLENGKILRNNINCYVVRYYSLYPFSDTVIASIG